MPKFREVVKLIFELHIFQIDIRKLQFLHSNSTTVFSHSLQNIYVVSTQYKLATFLCTSYSIIFGRYEINVGFGFIFVCCLMVLPDPGMNLFYILPPYKKQVIVEILCPINKQVKLLEYSIQPGLHAMRFSHCWAPSLNLSALFP